MSTQPYSQIVDEKAKKEAARKKEQKKQKKLAKKLATQSPTTKFCGECNQKIAIADYKDHMILCLRLEVQQQPKRKKKEVLPVNQPLSENQSNEYTSKTCFKFVDGSGYCKQCPLGKYACMVTVRPI
jgi:hypothetical protein